MDLVDESRCDPDGGMKHSIFDKLLRKYGKSRMLIRRSSNPKFGKMIDHLESGGSLAISFAYIDNDGIPEAHLAFVSGLSHTKKGLKMICHNYTKSCVKQTIPIENLYDSLLMSVDYREDFETKSTIDNFPNVWFLTRQENSLSRKNSLSRIDSERH